jgi:Uma2 family endonuclease
MPVPLRKGSKYTYSDYLTWPDDERWELIEGVAYDMSPAPSTKHQRIVWKVTGQIYNYLEGHKGCHGFTSPTDVVLDEHNVVQPDVFVVCDKAKIGEDNIKGAPDLIIDWITLRHPIKGDIL